MIDDDSNILHLAAIALILVFLALRRANWSDGGFFKSLLARRGFTNDHAVDQMFERHHIPALKTCPSCIEQLPLSTLICEACDYNFLSGMVGHGHKMLPAPEPRVYEMPTRIFAYRA